MTTLSIEEQKQYSRHLLVDEIGLSGQLLLKAAKVLVIGAGGLGCPVLQYLAAAGVGTLGIVDDDVVELSNLQRQILFTKNDRGKYKATTAAKRLQALNPFVSFEVYTERLTNENAIRLFENYDIVVDGTDNFSTRYLINDAAVLTYKPVVFGSIFKFTGQLSVLNYKNGPTYRCLFPTPPAPEKAANCSEVGVLGVLPGIIGCLQANEVLKIIVGKGKILSGMLLTFDALTMQQVLLPFEKNHAILITSLSDDYQGFCGFQSERNALNWPQFEVQSDLFNVLDVRTLLERQASCIPSIHIPLAELETRWHELPVDKKLIVYCKSGVRSQKALQILRKLAFQQELFTLKGGLEAYGI